MEIAMVTLIKSSKHLPTADNGKRGYHYARCEWAESTKQQKVELIRRTHHELRYLLEKAISEASQHSEPLERILIIAPVLVANLPCYFGNWGGVNHTPVDLMQWWQEACGKNMFYHICDFMDGVVISFSKEERGRVFGHEVAAIVSTSEFLPEEIARMVYL